MSLIAKETGGSFEIPPEGTHIGRCYRVCDIGTQTSEYQGEIKVKNQMIITWELPTELITKGDYAGQPFAVSKFYTNSLHENATLRIDLEAWRGKAFTAEELAGFETEKLVGAPCLINIVHTDKGKAKVKSVMGLTKGMKCPDQVNPDYVFNMDNWEQAKFDEMSDGMKRIIMQSKEYKQMTGDDVPPPVDPQGNAGNEPLEDDDIPF